MKYLNLGCGRRFHRDWINLNFASTGDGVIAHDLNQGIPYPDDVFDVVYHSHVLEHFPKSSAQPFLQECYRVLRPSGILRVVVPDLEQIARLYLSALEQATAGSDEWANRYNWIMLEMYDQSIRNRPGGEMLDYLYQDHLRDEAFLIERWGTEAKNLIAEGRSLQSLPVQPAPHPLKRSLNRLYAFFVDSHYRRDVLLKLLLKQDYTALQIGRFRQSGEIHQWMYDRYSLSQLLQQCGFEAVTQQTATTSKIANWQSFLLDTESDGKVYKPDSLFMEAVKSVC
ncbi:MAG: methyltransferase type 11 [Leptolyngbya sp. ERB_1_1]